jgi:hypothetical protein
MMNFPAWPCEYPSARIKEQAPKEVKPKKIVKPKKLYKKISSFQQQPETISFDHIVQDDNLKGEFLKSFDDYLNGLVKALDSSLVDIDTSTIKIDINKLAEGSYIVKSDAFINGFFDGFIGGYDLDDSYSKDGNIPFPKEPF